MHVSVIEQYFSFMAINNLEEILERAKMNVSVWKLLLVDEEFTVEVESVPGVDGVLTGRTVKAFSEKRTWEKIDCCITE